MLSDLKKHYNYNKEWYRKFNDKESRKAHIDEGSFRHRLGDAFGDLIFAPLGAGLSTAFERISGQKLVSDTGGAVQPQVPERQMSKNLQAKFKPVARNRRRRRLRQIKRQVKKDIASGMELAPKTANPALLARRARLLSRQAYMGKEKKGIVQYPIVSGGVYSGSKTTMTPSTRRKGMQSMNCTKLRTRAFIGTITYDSSSNVHITPTGASVNIGGQWFFAPTNAAYWATSQPFINLARMYQYFYLNSAVFDFESNIPPGLLTNFKTYVGFIEDPNLGESIIAGYTSTSTIGPGAILSLPDSISFPTWEARQRLRPPQRWFKDVRYSLRTYGLNEAIITNDNKYTAENKQSIPFGLWVSFNGTPPASGQPAQYMYDLFITVDMEFCELAPMQIYDNVGNTAFDKPAIPFVDEFVITDAERVLDQKKNTENLKSKSNK